MPDTLPPIPKGRGLIHFDKDIRLLSRDELAEHFASGTGRIVLRRLLRNIIWQAYERITVGKELGVGGNLRTFWYRFVKPTLAHIHDDDALKSDPYDRMLWVFGQMVMDWKLFKYRDFDLADENWQNRHIGKEHPDILVFAEKTGWMRWLRSVHKDLGVSVLALGGAPSALTSEFTVDLLGEALGGLEKTVHLVGVVDFDPAGDMIASSFRDQLGAAGLKKTTLKTLIHPKHYGPEELAMFKVPLPRGQKTKNRRWVEVTGGVGGAFGLEAESMPMKRLGGLLAKVLGGS